LKYSDSTAVKNAPPASALDNCWAALEQQGQRLREQPILSLFESDPQRFARYSIESDGLLADFSKQRIDAAGYEALLALYEKAGTAEAIEALYNGEPLNFTENRPALHMACRGSVAAPRDDAEQLRAASQQMRTLAQALRQGSYRGVTGQPIENVINLGIGGSDLGPRMVTEALQPTTTQGHARVRFVANIDPSDLAQSLTECRAESTLFIISSKSFTTVETLSNAQVALQWLSAELGTEQAAQHMLAVTHDVEAARNFGLEPANVLGLPVWVGGRYSVWSAIGLPLMIAIGESEFDRLLDGARAIDAHFRAAPAPQNIPVMMALYGLWNINALGLESHAALPYAHGLRSFPTWLQQLDMESNGKQCHRDGHPVGRHTAPIVWGAAGTIGQHAFYQLIYQGTRPMALDFIVPLLGTERREQLLLENAVAQSEALMRGRTLSQARQKLGEQGLQAEEIERLAPHLVCPGSQPSTTLVLSALNSYHLGQLLALYEHKVFVQGWIWGINSFDQYGVELGKDMARHVAEATADDAHPATAGLLAAIDRMRVHNG